MITKLNEKKLKLLVREGVKEALDSYGMKVKAFLLPFISSKEQKEIERLYGRPTRKIVKVHMREL